MRMQLRHVAVLALLPLAALAASERGSVSATVAGRKVSIDYGRPALKGRALADLMKQLSSDRVWRTGDDQVTTLNAEADFMLGGKRIKAGKYSVYVQLPEDGSRHLLLNTDLGQPLSNLWAAAPDNMKNEPWPYIGDYQAKIGAKEVVRAAMKKETVKSPLDTFTIQSSQIAGGGARLTLSWGDESWSIDLEPAK